MSMMPARIGKTCAPSAWLAVALVWACLAQGCGAPQVLPSETAAKPAAQAAAPALVVDRVVAAQEGAAPFVPLAPPGPVGSATPAPMYWPDSELPVDAFLEVLEPRQRDCILMSFEREGMTARAVGDMDAFPRRNLLEQSKTLCTPVLLRTAESRLRRDIRCTLDLPGEPVSRCDESYARVLDGRVERLNPREAIRAELESAGDPARRVTIVRFERPDAELARKGGVAKGPSSVTVEPVAAIGAIVAVPPVAEAAAIPEVPSASSQADPAPAAGAISVPATAPAPVPAPVSAPVSAPEPSTPSATYAAAAAPAPARLEPATSPSTPSPAGGAAASPAPEPIVAGSRIRVLITCGTPERHVRVQDCFDSGAAAALVLKTGGQQRSLRLTDLLRAGPSGRDGLSFEVLAPVEIRARNVSDQWVLGIGLVDPATGAVHVRETAARGGTILLRR